MAITASLVIATGVWLAVARLTIRHIGNLLEESFSTEIPEWEEKRLMERDSG